MDVYYRENTGIITAQEEKLDVFSIKNVGANLFDNTAYGEIYFWRDSQHAFNGLEPRAIRVVEFPIETNRSIDDGIAVILSLENYPTTSGDLISLSGAEKIEP